MSSTLLPPVTRLLSDALFGEIARAKENGGLPDLGAGFEFLTYALTRCKISSAQLAQDLWALFETGEKRDGYFVEFGAADGVTLSNSWLLEREFGWNGVLAEPNPVFHEALAKNRRCYVSTRCVTGEGEREVTFNQTDEPLFSTIDRYSTCDIHIARRITGSRITVQAQTLEELLVEAGAPRSIDYMSVDTEGSEYEILQSFDFAKYDIHLLTVEHNHTPQRGLLRTLLEANGFELRFPDLTRFDDWYVNTRIPPASPQPN